MNTIEIFESLIKSDLSAEEVYNKIIEINPIETKEKYTNDDHFPLAIYKSGIGENDLVTVLVAMNPYAMKFDVKSIYIEFIEFIRKELINSNKSFRDLLIKAVKFTSITWFKNKETPEAKENQKNIKISEELLKKYKIDENQLREYLHRISTFDEENQLLVHNLSQFAGTGKMAKCAEVNSVACNLLNFCGIPSVLVQGQITDYNRNSEYHTFPLYKDISGNYSLLDCKLKVQWEEVLPENINFEEGFKFNVPIVIRKPNEPDEQVNYTYSISPQKLVIKNEGMHR